MYPSTRSLPHRLAMAAIAAVVLFSAVHAGQSLFDPTPLDVSEPPEHWDIPPAPPRQPEESMTMFDLPPGLSVEVVASEPIVQDPIAMAFDERGRIWVLEWPAYNWPLRDLFDEFEEKEAPGSRVVILEDTDDDGRMDKRTVFLDDIEWPRGLLVHRDGAVVFKLPEIVFARDTNDDGAADTVETILGGLEIPANPHRAPSSPLRGMDNWIHSLRTEHRMRDRDGTWSLKPQYVLGGQWGLSHDNYGRLFYGYNEDPLRGDFVPAHYFARNPNYPRSAGISERVMHDREVWPHAITPGINRRGQMREEDGKLRIFTANSGPSIYRGDLLPSEYVGNAFIGETAGQLIRRAVVTEEEGIVRAQNAYDEKEFLFSHDERFRPVHTATGPDGALYVADMYRGVIEGHIFVTTFLYNQILERNLHRPFNGMGRIYRIVPEDREPAPVPSIDRSKTEEWVPLLGHANGFWRDTAQRVIVENGDRSAVPLVRDLALESDDELARLHALWTLEGLDAIDADLLVEALADGSFRVRQAAVRVAEPFLGDSDVLSGVVALADDQRIDVRRQVLLSLGEVDTPRAEAAMRRILRRDASEPIMVEGAVSGLAGRERRFLEALLDDAAWEEETPGGRKLIAALAEAVLGTGEEEPVNELLRRVAAESLPLWQQTAILDGLNNADRQVLGQQPPALADVVRSSNKEVASRAETLLENLLIGDPGEFDDLPVGLADRDFYLEGREAFAVCASCHGQQGEGLEGVAPALATSTAVAGPQKSLIQLILEGREEDPDYPAMPPLAGLSDEQIASIVYYLRATWAGRGNVVRPGQVSEVREEIGGGGRPGSD